MKTKQPKHLAPIFKLALFYDRLNNNKTLKWIENIDLAIHVNVMSYTPIISTF